MPAYDAKQFTPPAPLAMVTIRTRDRTKMVSDVPMQIDSGADDTLIPQTCGDQLGLRGKLQEDFLLVGFNGSTSPARVIDAEVLFLGRIFRGEFALTDDEVGVLGRNVLNRLCIVLDGPRLSWREGP
jgi:hypothetical protein